MESRNITLRRGIECDGIRHRSAEIRELTVGELLEIAESGATDEHQLFRQIARRLVRLGNLQAEQLGELMLRKLAVDDFRRLVLAAESLDRECSEWGEEPSMGRSSPHAALKPFSAEAPHTAKKEEKGN